MWVQNKRMDKRSIKPIKKNKKHERKESFMFLFLQCVRIQGGRRQSFTQGLFSGIATAVTMTSAAHKHLLSAAVKKWGACWETQQTKHFHLLGYHGNKMGFQGGGSHTSSAGFLQLLAAVMFSITASRSEGFKTGRRVSQGGFKLFQSRLSGWKWKNMTY